MASIQSECWLARNASQVILRNQTEKLSARLNCDLLCQTQHQTAAGIYLLRAHKLQLVLHARAVWLVGMHPMAHLTTPTCLNLGRMQAAGILELLSTALKPAVSTCL